jgi:hypothetical protein
MSGIELPEDCRSLRYFLQGFGMRVLSRKPVLVALLLRLIASTFLAAELARYPLPWMQEKLSQGAYIALIFATKWLLVALAGDVRMGAGAHLPVPLRLLPDGRHWEPDRDPQVPAALLTSQRDALIDWPGRGSSRPE